MRIGFVELVLLLFIASLTVGPNVALFVDRWLRRAQRTSAAAARRKAQLEAQAAIEREALLTRFRVASNVFALLLLAALAYGLLLRPIETPPKAYTVPDVRQDTGAARTELSADSKDGWKLGDYLGVDCVRTEDGLVYAAAYDGASMKKRKSDLVRTDGGHNAAILSVEGELTGFAFDRDGDLWLTVVTPTGGTLCRARHDSWGTSVEPVVTQLDGAPLGALSAVEAGPDGKVYFAAAAETSVKNGLEGALRTELLAHTGTGWVYVYDPADRSVQRVLGGIAGASGLALSEDGGKTFPMIRWMERGEGFMGDENKTNNKQYEYPYLMQSRDGAMHLTYAARTRQGIKYIRFREEDVMGAKRETVGLYNPTAAQTR